MIIAKFLSSDDAVHVCLHQFLNDVHLSKVIQARRAQNVDYGYDILMVEMPEEFDFSKSTETEHGVIKRSYTLDSDFSI